jgi:hypothetical protein
MRIFFAGGEADMRYWAPGFTDVLVAFGQYTKRHALGDPLWFLDSGAYSFMQKGMNSTDALESYIEYLTHGQGVGHQRYAVMDVIGDVWQKTWANDQRMREAGLNPISCVHAGEPPETIRRYLEAGVTNLALGGSAGQDFNRSEVEAWTDKVFAVVNQWMKKTGSPLPRIHAFGQTSFSRLIRYPFYSADSTVWLTSHRFGEVLVFDKKKMRLASLHPRRFSEGSLKLDYQLPLAALDGYLKPSGKQYRSAWNINQTLHMVDFLTDLWRRRGVEWDDEDQRQHSAQAQRTYLAEHWPEAMARDTRLVREHVWA